MRFGNYSRYRHRELRWSEFAENLFISILFVLYITVILFITTVLLRDRSINMIIFGIYLYLQIRMIVEIIEGDCRIDNSKDVIRVGGIGAGKVHKMMEELE